MDPNFTHFQLAWTISPMRKQADGESDAVSVPCVGDCCFFDTIEHHLGRGLRLISKSSLIPMFSPKTAPSNSYYLRPFFQAMDGNCSIYGDPYGKVTNRYLHVYGKFATPRGARGTATWNKLKALYEIEWNLPPCGDSADKEGERQKTSFYG
jgi:hypothetical protein